MSRKHRRSNSGIDFSQASWVPAYEGMVTPPSAWIPPARLRAMKSTNFQAASCLRDLALMQFASPWMTVARSRPFGRTATPPWSLMAGVPYMNEAIDDRS